MHRGGVFTLTIRPLASDAVVHLFISRHMEKIMNENERCIGLCFDAYFIFMELN